MHEFFRLQKWITYQWRAKTKYYLHSPFVYRFYLDVLEGKDDENMLAIRALRKELAHNNTLIQPEGFGAGEGGAWKISALESKVAVRPAYGKVLYYLVKKFRPAVILELGTSIGMGSAYLAMGNRAGRVITVEGSARLIEIATNNHTKLNLENIETINGNFDDCLDEVLDSIQTPDMVFLDGNHRKDATLQYFEKCLARANENSVFIFDDIYWSPEMNEAWKEIKRHPKVKLTLDIYQLGICFFMPAKLAKEDFMLRY